MHTLINKLQISVLGTLDVLTDFKELYWNKHRTMRQSLKRKFIVHNFKEIEVQVYNDARAAEELLHIISRYVPSIYVSFAQISSVFFNGLKFYVFVLTDFVPVTLASEKTHLNCS